MKPLRWFLPYVVLGAMGAVGVAAFGQNVSNGEPLVLRHESVKKEGLVVPASPVADATVADVPAPVEAVELVQGPERMTGTQQFWLAMAAQWIAMVVGLVTLWLQSRKTTKVAEGTHVLVNSQLTEFKKLLGEVALREAVDARAEGVREGRESKAEGSKRKT